MEQKFHFQIAQPLLGVGEASSAVSFDDAYIHNLFPGLSYLSLLTNGSVDPAAENRNPLKMPKTEPLFAAFDGGVSAEVPPYKFFEAASSSLPSLFSFEQPQYVAAVESSPILLPNPRVETVSHGNQRGRKQPQKLSDKTRCLQKLLPWTGKMDMATVLEEAYKYIKFLQAQVRVLQSMPCESGGGAINGGMNIVGGDLGRLNRQQLLQVVVNSPAAQTQLCSTGCCLYSMEQLALLKKKAEKKALYDQMMMLGSSNLNPSFPEHDGRGCRFF